MLTKAEKDKFEKWIIENVDERVVPQDEGNPEALVYNLVHLLRGDKRQYDYTPDQDAELKSWGL